MYTRPVGKAYVTRNSVFAAWWTVWVTRTAGPVCYRVETTWRDAVDTALWYNETYYHPTDKEN